MSQQLTKEQKLAKVMDLVRQRARAGDLKAGAILLENGATAEEREYVCDVWFEMCFENQDMDACQQWIKHC